jgi:hypothetical protein
MSKTTHTRKRRTQEIQNDTKLPSMLSKRSLNAQVARMISEARIQAGLTQ